MWRVVDVFAKGDFPVTVIRSVRGRCAVAPGMTGIARAGAGRRAQVGSVVAAETACRRVARRIIKRAIVGGSFRAVALVAVKFGMD
ncbi:MAG: hypothetical protein A2X58_03075 [Nitrospirae bacterium GWC2_56_14]|nr:MAG: hypothetical protein A2X58_03075 [Nitrospirae bacterium GWC2_56_14]